MLSQTILLFTEQIIQASHFLAVKEIAMKTIIFFFVFCFVLFCFFGFSRQGFSVALEPVQELAL